MQVRWRAVLIYTHRWLGIAGCLIFAVWFLSGIVMMYERMPRLTAEERLARLAPVDLAAIRVEPAAAAAAARVEPVRARIGRLADRPVYRFLDGGRWTTVFADTGAPLKALTADEALDVVRRFLPESSASARYVAHLVRPDQWTLDGGLPRFLPLHQVALDDAAGTFVYVSDRTGEVVMKTTARGRRWGWLGAVLHWTYFTPFRLQPGLWRWSIIYAALIGCVMCLTGLVAGIWRFSPSARYRIRRQLSHSPYAGLLWWHHYAGLLFGLFTFTWALSGALSLTPWDWAPSTSPTPEQSEAAMGGPFDLARFSVDAIRTAAASLAREVPFKELELLQFRGDALLLAYRPPDLGSALRVTNPDLRAFQSAELAIDHRLVRLTAPGRVFDRFSDDEMMQVASDAGDGAPVRDAVWLSDYDAYYYDRHGGSPLPVLRVRYDDELATWLYLAPTAGAIVMKQERLSRVNRWVYNDLHSLDFPGLWNRRPLWDAVVVLLSLGGLASTLTPIAAAWHRCKRLLSYWLA